MFLLYYQTNNDMKTNKLYNIINIKKYFYYIIILGIIK